MNIDLHSHVVPDTFVRAVEKAEIDLGAKVVGTADRRSIRHDDGLEYLLVPELYNVQAKLEGMNRKGLDISAISPGPPMFYYHAGLDQAVTVAKLVNDGIALMVAEAPDRLRGLATVPLQHPDAAVAELERIAKEYDCFRGVELGTTVNGDQVADARFRPVLRKAQELGFFVFGHPFFLDTRCGFGEYYFHNLVGNPLDTAMMAAHLIFSGALEDLPDLRVCLAHGGGYFPYQVGRLNHGHTVRHEGKVRTQTPPIEHLRRFYFDALLHHPEAIRYLIDLVGADRVVIGTDDPYDMGTETPIQTLDAVRGLTQSDRHLVCCGTASDLLREPGLAKIR